MPAIDFPASPSLNDEYTFEGRTWLWNGTGWEVKSYPAALQLGSASAPSLYFTGDPNTGLYSPGADQVAITTGGTGRLFIDGNGMRIAGTSVVPAVVESTQSLSFLTYKDSATTDNPGFGSSGNNLVGYTSSTERLRITSDGNVGIGTSSPSTVYRTTINGNGSTIVGGLSLRNNGTEVLTIGTVTAANATDCEVWNAANGYLRFATNNTERLRITSDGKVGIGTSSPGNLLTVTGAATNVALAYFVGTDADNSNGIEVKAGGVNSGKYIGSFRDAADNIRFHILADGKVGIGTSSPQERLHVQAATNATSLLITTTAATTAGDYSQIGFGDSAAGAAAFSAIRATFNNPSTNGASALRFFTNTGSATTEKVAIDSTGRLLVGTSAAIDDLSSKLQVADITGGNTLLWHGSATATAAGLQFAKNRTTTATHAIVSSGDRLGRISFSGSDGASYIVGAWIQTEVDGTPGLNDMPGRLVFSTTADGAASPTERLRIAQNGAWGLAGANYGTAGQVFTSNGTGSAPTWQDNAAGFPAGTAMLFVQTAAPTGWTKSTTHDNKALRVVSGTASSGGSTAFTTVFASRTPAGTVGNTTLTTSQIPSHSHTLRYASGTTATAFLSTHKSFGDAVGGGANLGAARTADMDTIINAEGGGGSHNHSFTGTAMDFAVQYVDAIIATKN